MIVCWRWNHPVVIVDNVINSDTLATFKQRLKTHIFTVSCETFFPPSASAFLMMTPYKFHHCIVLYVVLIIAKFGIDLIYIYKVTSCQQYGFTLYTL